MRKGKKVELKYDPGWKYSIMLQHRCCLVFRGRLVSDLCFMWEYLTPSGRWDKNESKAKRFKRGGEEAEMVLIKLRLLEAAHRG